MAKKSNDDLEFDFEDFDFDNFGDDGEGGFSDQPQGKPRSPILQLMGSVSSGIRSNITDPNVQGKFIKEALPPGYQQAFSVASDTVSTARSLYDNIVKEAKPVIKESKKALRLIMPAVKSVTPKKLGEALEEWSKDDSRVREDLPNPEDSEIAMTLGSIFNNQLDAQREMQQQSDSKQELRDIVMSREMRSQGDILQSIEKGIIRQVSYQDQVTSKVQQKSLELQYRQYFTARKALDVHEQMLELSKAAYQDIIKNTALPDVVKVHNSERAEQILKEKFFGKVTDSMGPWFRGIGRRLVDRSKSKVKEFFSDLGGTVNDMVMMGEMVQEQLQSSQEMGAGGSARDMGIDMAGEAIGGGLVNKLASMITKPIRKRMDESGKATANSLALLRFFQDMPGFINDWTRSDTTQSGYTGSFIDFIKESIGSNVRSDKLQSSMVDHLDQQQNWTLQNSKTLNIVIPGWLARIEKNTRFTASKGKDKDMLQFDFETASFEKVDDIKKKISKKMYKETDIKSINENAMKVLNKIDPPDDTGKFRLTADARKALLKFILDKAHNRKQLTMAQLAADELPYEIPVEFHDEIRDAVRDRFHYDVNARRDSQGNFINPLGPFQRESAENQRELKAVSDEFAGLQRWFPDMMEKLLREARLGNAVLLKELKLVTQDEEGTFNADYTNMMEYLQDPTKLPAHARGGFLRRAKGGGVNKVGNRVKNRMANRFTSGKLSGPGGKFDDKIPLLASNGEYMVNADSVSKPGVLPVLRAIDALGDIPDHVQQSGSNDYANSDLGAVEAAVDSLSASAKEGVDLTNELLTQIRDLTKIMTEKTLFGGIGADPKLMEKGKTWLDKVLKLGKKTGKGIFDGVGKTFSTAGNIAGGVGKIAIGAGQSMYKMANEYLKEKREAVKDIFVNGEKDAVLSARDIESGKLVDKTTGKVITCLDDIKGEVIDDKGNTVLKMSDYAKGLHDKSRSVLTWLTDKVNKTWDNSIGLIPRIAKSTFNYTRDLLDGPTDIFVGDETTPRLKKVIFEAGGYFSAKTGKAIRYLSDLGGIIKDKDGIEIIGLADLEKGLFDVNRQPIKGLNNRIKAVLKDTTKLPGQVFKFATDTVNIASDKVSGLYDKLFRRKTLDTNNQRLDENGNPIMGPFLEERQSLLTRIKDKFKGTASTVSDKVTEVVSGKAKEGWLVEITDRLDDVYDLLDWRLDMVIKRMNLSGGLDGDEAGAPPVSRRRLGIKGKLKGLKDKAFDKLSKAKDFILGKLPSLDTIKEKFKGLKDKLPGKDSIKDMLTGVKDKVQGAGMIAGAFIQSKYNQAKELMGDILDKTTGKVALSWKKLKDGEYIDKLTGKIITKWEEVKGDIVDKAGRLVASVTEWKDKFMDEKGKPLKAKFLEKLSNLKDKATEFLTKASGAATIMKMAGLSKLRDLKEKITDLYTSKMEGAKLYWKDLKAGEYFDQLTGKAIQKWKDIKGAVTDRTGKIVLTLQEYMDGLKDAEGKSIGQRVLGKLKSGLTSAKNLGKAVWGGIKSGIGNAKDWVGDKLSGGLDWFKSFLPFGKGKEEGDGFSFFGNNKVVDRLDKIYVLLDERLNKPASKFGDTDGDGDAENTLQDQRAKNEAEEAKDKEKGFWANMFSKLKGGGKDGDKKGMDITDLLSKATGFITKAVGALTGFFSGGTIGKIVSWVMSGKGAAVRGVAMLAGAGSTIAAGASAVGGAIATGAAAVAGAVTLPGVITGVAVAAVAYGGYKLFQNFNRDEKPLLTYRMAQYGYDVDDTDECSAIATLEKECASIVRVDERGASLARGKNAGDFLKIFGVDADDADDVDSWVAWFKYRFTPVYLKHVHAMFLLKKKTDLSLADTGLTSKEQLSYLTKVSMSDIKPSPYETMQSPFGSGEVDLDKDDVKDAYDVAKDSIEDNAEETDSRQTTQKEVKKSLLEKAKDSMSDFGKSVKEKYQSAIDFTSDAMSKGKDMYDKAVNFTSKAIEYGADKYNKAVDYTSQAIEKGANAASYVSDKIAKAVQWSKNAPPQLFESIRNAAKRYGIDEGYLLTMAYIESKGDPMAKSSTDCRGIYQFTKGTGKQYGLIGAGGDQRYDMEANVDAGARFARDNYKALTKAIGGPPAPWMLYMAHQQGMGGVVELINAAREGREVRNVGKTNMRRAMDLNGGKGLTPQQFLDKWRNDYNAKQAKITGQSTGVTPVKQTPTTPPPTSTGMVDVTKQQTSANASATKPVDKTAPPTAEPKKEVLPTSSSKDAVKPAITASTAVAPAATTDKPVETPVVQRAKEPSINESFDVSGAKQQQAESLKQVEMKRQSDMQQTLKANAMAADILQKQLDVQTTMSTSLKDIKDILSRMEKAKGKMQGETSIRQGDSKTRETEVLQASQTRPLEKPPVSMSR